MLIYDSYTDDYYEVIPVKNIQKMIEKLYEEKCTDDDEMFVFREVDITQNKIDVLQQVIIENTESEE